MLTPDRPGLEHGRHRSRDILITGLDVGGHRHVNRRDDLRDDRRGPLRAQASVARPALSGTPRDQATPALVVAIAFAPAEAIATAEATSHAFGSSSGSPALCSSAKALARCACSVVMTATLASRTPASWPDPDSYRRSAAPNTARGPPDYALTPVVDGSSGDVTVHGFGTAVGR